MTGFLASAGALLVGIIGFAMWLRGKAEADKDAIISDLKRAEEIHVKADLARVADASPVDDRLRAHGALRD